MFRRSCLALVVALAVVGVVGVAPAAAHIELEVAAPAPGTVLPAAPASISLTFSTTPVTVGVDVVGPDGEAVAVGELVRQEATVEVPLPALERAGTYTVKWRAANDAHPFTGEYTLVLDLPTTTTTEPPTTTSSAPPPTASIPAAATGGQSDGGGGSGTTAVVVGGVALVLAALAAVLWARTRRGARPATG